ncbi:MAG: ATP-binding protein [bacterium]
MSFNKRMYGMAHQSTIITAGINFFLAFYVLFKSSGWNRALNRFFSFLSFGFALWNIGTAYNSTLLIYIGIFLLPPAFHTFLLAFLRQFNQLERLFGILVSILSALSIFTCFYFFTYQPAAPFIKYILDSVAMALSAPVFIWGVYRLGNSIQVSRSSRERFQMIFVLVSLFAAAFAGLFAGLTVLGLDIVSWSAIAGLVYTIAIIPAIIWQRLSDTKQLASYLVTTITLSMILWLLFGVLGHFDLNKRPLTFLSMLTISLVIVMLFEPMKSFIEEQAFRLFSTDIAEFLEDLNRFGLTVNNYLEEETLIKDFADLLRRSTRIHSFSIFTMDSNQNMLVFHDGEDPRFQPGATVNVPILLVETIKSTRKPISRNQLALELRSGLIKQLHDERLQLYRILNRFRSSEIYPFLFGGHFYGFLSIALRDSEIDLTNSERDALFGIACQLTAALAHMRLEKFNRASEHLVTLGRLASGLAHEIRNPLATIKAGIQYLELDGLDSEAEEFHMIIRDEVDRLERFIHRFLDYARPSFHENQQPRKSLEDILKKFKTTSLCPPESMHCRLEIYLDPSAATIELPVDSWTQIFSNLLSNAFCAIDSKGIVQIKANLSSSKSALEISIEDTGPGIPEEERLAVFEPFYSKHHGGIGLGLAIVRKIIQGMNGTILCSHSSLGGAAFFIRVPLD